MKDVPSARETTTHSAPAVAGLWSVLVREPLAYFVVVGALVFGADAALRRDARVIRIAPSVRSELSRTVQARVGHPPDRAELDKALEAWKEQQALYREAVRLGLRDDDPIVVAYAAGKLLDIARERSVLLEPTEPELREFFDRNRSRFAVPATYAFDQVFVSSTHPDAEQQVELLVAELRSGTSPDGLGDWFPRGVHFRGETANDLTQLFGDEAARAIVGYAVGDWNIVRGRQGFHAVRITAVDRGEPDYDHLRSTLVQAYDAERRDKAALAYAQEVVRQYRFVDAR